MRNGFLASLAGSLVGASLVLGQPPLASLPPGESKLAPAEPAEAPPPPLHAGVLDGLTSHFDGTCHPPSGGVFLASAEYLFWVLKNPHVPPALASTDFLSSSTARVLIGEHDLAYHHRPSSGTRLSLAYWQEDPLPEFEWDRPRTVGVEANFLYLGERSISTREDTPPVIVRPFFDLNNRRESGVVVAAPGLATGSLEASASYGMWGTEVNVWKNVYYEYPGRTIRLDLLAGFCYLDLGEDLSISRFTAYGQNLQGTVVQGLDGSRILESDLFATRNQFYGGQLGGVLKFFLDRIDVNMGCKVAMGANAGEIHIDGFQVRTLRNGTTVPSRGGLLALASNIGRFHRGEFAVVPQVDVGASYPICRHISVSFDYTFLYWSKVFRPAEQIDRVLDITQIPNFAAAGAAPTGMVRPGVPFKDTDFWAQGISFGLQIIW